MQVAAKHCGLGADAMFIVTSYDKCMSGATLIPKNKRTQAVRGRPPTGRAQFSAERMRRYRERQRAPGLRAVTRMEAPARTLSGGALKHRIIEARSLAMHCLAAQKIMLEPALLDWAHATRLRQSTPFAGVLSERERERIYAAFRP